MDEFTYYYMLTYQKHSLHRSKTYIFILPLKF